MRVTRVPGIGLFYSDTAHGVPPVFTHFLTHLPAVPEVSVNIRAKLSVIPAAQLKAAGNTLCDCR